MLELKLGGWNYQNSWVSYAWRQWFRERKEMRELRGVVCIIKNRGPRTVPWETPYRRKYIKKKVHFHIWMTRTRWQVGIKPMKNGAVNTKRRGEVSYQNVVTDSVKSRQRLNCFEKYQLYKIFPFWSIYDLMLLDYKPMHKLVSPTRR